MVFDIKRFSVYKVLICSLALPIFIVGCFGSSSVLEHDYTSFDTIKEIGDPTTAVKISGLVLHSSLAVNKIKVIKNGNEIQIFIYLKIAKKDLTGNFDYTVDVPADVTRITFGRERFIVWERRSDENL